MKLPGEDRVGSEPHSSCEPSREHRPRRSWQSVALLVSLGVTGLADVSHVVAPGESLWKISRRYGTTPEAIAAANGLSNPHLIAIGQQLRIPEGGAVEPPVAPAPATSTGEHTVASGDSLWAIARRYGASIADLVAMNKLADPDVLRIGQILTIPAAPVSQGPPTVEQLLERYGRQYGVDPALVKGLAWQESGWQQGVVSSAGAIGVMQVRPETARFIGRWLLGHHVNLQDVDHNVKAGVRFLAYLMKKTGGDEKTAVAGYFQGLRSVRTRGISGGTKRYVANVLALKRRFAGGGQ